MTDRYARRGMTGRYARLAARLVEVEDELTELLARVERLELHTRVPTTLDRGAAPDRERRGTRRCVVTRPKCSLAVVREIEAVAGVSTDVDITGVPFADVAHG